MHWKGVLQYAAMGFSKAPSPLLTWIRSYGSAQGERASLNPFWFPLLSRAHCVPSAFQECNPFAGSSFLRPCQGCLLSFTVGSTLCPPRKKHSSPTRTESPSLSPLKEAYCGIFLNEMLLHLFTLQVLLTILLWRYPSYLLVKGRQSPSNFGKFILLLFYSA